MVSNPQNKWSYGPPAEPEPTDGDWSPGSVEEARPGETIRLSSGRWASSRLVSGPPDDPTRASGDVAASAERRRPAATEPEGRLTGDSIDPRDPFGEDLTADPSRLDTDTRPHTFGDGPRFDGSGLAPSYGGGPSGGTGFDRPGLDDGGFRSPQFEHDLTGRFAGPRFDYDGRGPAGPGLDDGFDQPPTEVEFEEHGSSARGGAKNAIEWAVVLVGAVLLALVLRAVLLQAFWIPSPSMESTLEIRDRVLVNKLSYRLHDINRGDVVVFRRTDEEIAQNPELPRDVIKRVVALPGETIEVRDNTVVIDGNVLVEPYLDEGIVTEDFGPETVPEGHVFVMGDNRGQSLDSRFETGPVAEDRVVGRAFFLFWPVSRMGSL